MNKIKNYLIKKLEKYSFQTLKISCENIEQLEQLVPVLKRLKYKYIIHNLDIKIENLVDAQRDFNNIDKQTFLFGFKYKTEIIKNQTLMGKLYNYLTGDK